MQSPAETLAKKLKVCSRKNDVHGREIVWECKLREKRDSLGLTLMDISEATKIGAATLNNIERGTDPTLATARKIADFFGCSTEEMWPVKKLK